MELLFDKIFQSEVFVDDELCLNNCLNDFPILNILLKFFIA